MPLHSLSKQVYYQLIWNRYGLNYKFDVAGPLTPLGSAKVFLPWKSSSPEAGRTVAGQEGWEMACNTLACLGFLFDFDDGLLLFRLDCSRYS